MPRKRNGMGGGDYTSQVDYNKTMGQLFGVGGPGIDRPSNLPKIGHFFKREAKRVTRRKR
jgi:hypothetical protein